MKQEVLPGCIAPPTTRPSKARKNTRRAANESPPAELEQWPPLHDMLGAMLSTRLPSAAPARVTVMGLGAERHLSPSQRKLLDSAELIAGGRALLNKWTPGWEHNDTRAYLPLQSPLNEALDRIEVCYRAGLRVLVLADGDPLFYGIGATLARRMGPASLHILPGPSSLQEACARLGLPWHTVRAVSLHGRDDWRSLNSAVCAGRPVCVLTDAASTPNILARHLLDRGVDWFAMAVFERMGHDDAVSRCLSLQEAASVEDFDAASTVILWPERAARRPVLGLAGSTLAVERGLVTKAPVRAAALSLLRIAPRHTVWDIGAGSGTLALEACALAHQGCVVAVERSPDRALTLHENRRRFGAAILDIHTGHAPDCFDHLPAPDRIFIGGGMSSQAREMLETACAYLKPGGRLVVSCVLMGTVHASLDCLRQNGWPVEMLHVQCAHAVPLAGDIRLAAYNPVFLVACEKPLLAPVSAAAAEPDLVAKAGEAGGANGPVDFLHTVTDKEMP